ncbi:Gfo/Idh/MocA family protein [Planctopirus hydrillae]|uniref:Streptomycin biosynthesis protein StrI n=1 Tax=Planctopirus hydrillae TaxID=1841610 RepID=A0A1C3END5_9PLAN|nr:Gfo/Idh/MocA family oxidoreductase [Planctopirus hydrillae]ODA34735.1 streptomycin biosynthesis protein StrI [Planctopirus hydrillae]
MNPANSPSGNLASGTSQQPRSGSHSIVSRRDVLRATGALATTSMIASMAIPQTVYAGEDNTIKVALVGCGGRGTGAAANALSVKNQGPIKLVAMADVFPNRLNSSYEGLKGQFKDQVDVPEDRRFVGFEAYKQAIDCLSPGDVVIMATPPAFRWVQFTYAIAKDVNTFMEKPVTVDGPSTKRMLQLADESEKKNLKVGVGLMCRHCDARGELFKRIQDGEIGDLLLLRAYRMAGPTATAFAKKKPESQKELMYQIQNFHAFLWASGGGFSDFLIHNIDECCWMKNAWPVKAQATGGRHFRGDYVDQNFDQYAVEYTFADGTKLLMEGRTMPGCHQEFASYAHGSKGAAVISQSGHAPSRARTYKSQDMSSKDNILWQFGPKEPSPYQLEWDHLVEAIRKDRPYNEVRRGAEASLVTSMGRMAAHTGQVITYDAMLNCDHEFAPNVDSLTEDGPAPVVADAEGKYPVPMPGLKTTREY